MGILTFYIFGDGFGDDSMCVCVKKAKHSMQMQNNASSATCGDDGAPQTDAIVFLSWCCAKASINQLLVGGGSFELHSAYPSRREWDNTVSLVLRRGWSLVDTPRITRSICFGFAQLKLQKQSLPFREETTPTLSIYMCLAQESIPKGDPLFIQSPKVWAMRVVYMKNHTINRDNAEHRHSPPHEIRRRQQIPKYRIGFDCSLFLCSNFATLTHSGFVLDSWGF